MTDAVGDVIERYSYDAYGEVKIEDGDGIEIEESAIGNVYLFSSRRYDVDTGLYYYRNHMYSPSMGRFMQRDPMWYEDGLNLYAYVGNNSVMYIDPMGLDKFGSTDLKGYSEKDFGKAFEKAGIVTDAANVTLLSMRTLKVGTEAVRIFGRVATATSTIISSYGLYEGVSEGDPMKIAVSGSDLVVGFATLAVAGESPGAAAAMTVIYVGGKWGVLSGGSDYVVQDHSSGGAGANASW